MPEGRLSFQAAPGFANAPIGSLAIAGLPAYDETGRGRKIPWSKSFDALDHGLGIGQIVLQSQEILQLAQIGEPGLGYFCSAEQS